MKHLLPLIFALGLAAHAPGQDDAPPEPAAEKKADDKAAKKEAAEKKAAEKKAAEEEKKKKEALAKKAREPVSSGAIWADAPGEADLQPKSDSASVKAILPRFGGPQPVMVVTEVSAEIIDEPEAPEMQATFELKPKLDFTPMKNAVNLLAKKYKSKGWPKNKTAHFIIDEIQADSAPTNFAAAVLIDAMLSGVEIPENVVLFSAIDKGGKITRGGDKKRTDASYIEAIKLAASAALPPAEEEDEEEKKKKRSRPSSFAPVGPQPDKTIYLITGDIPTETLDDVIIDQDWATLNSVIVLRCATLEDAMATIRSIGAGDALGKSITDLAEAQKVLREKSVRMLANDAIWSRVVAAGKASKNNVTAFAYARMKARKISETYSLDRCIGHMSDVIATAKDGSLEKLPDRDLRKRMRDLVSELEAFDSKTHPDAEPLVEAGSLYIGAIEDRIKAKKKAEDKEKDKEKKKSAKIPERDEEKYQAAKKAYEDAMSAARAKL